MRTIVSITFLSMALALNGCGSIGAAYLAGANGLSVEESDAWYAEGLMGREAREWRDAKFEPHEAKEWKAFGFSPEEANLWKHATDRQLLSSSRMEPIAAQLWKQLNIAPNEAGWWTASGIQPTQAFQIRKNPDIQAWRKNGIPYSKVDSWKKAGFTPDEAETWNINPRNTEFSPESIAAWKKSGFTPDEASLWRGYSLEEALEKRKARNTRLEVCPKFLSQDELMNMNPFAVKGQCFQINVASPFQILSKNSGLFKLIAYKTQLAMFDFGKAIAPNATISAYVIGIGTFKYTATSGELMNVPWLRVVETFPKD